MIVRDSFSIVGELRLLLVALRRFDVQRVTLFVGEGGLPLSD